MPILIAIMSIFMPRVVLFFIFLLTHWFAQAYNTIIWPLLGFFFMPYTTLVYMGTMLTHKGTLTAGWIVALVVAVLVDLGQFKVFSKK